MLAVAANTAWHFLRSELSEFHLFVSCTIAFHLIAFWPLCLALMYLDVTQSPQWLYKYKIQKKHKHGWNSYKKTIQQAVISQIVSVFFAMLVYFVTNALDWKVSISEELPSPWTFLLHLVAFVIVEEIGFFYSHYAFHSKFFYKRIHAFHHQFTAPVGMACIYAHPLEHMGM